MNADTSKPTFDPQPVTLTGRHVRLEPLSLSHAAGLFDAAQDDAIWRYLSVPRPYTVKDVQAWIEPAIKLTEQGAQAPFTIFHQATNQPVGSTRFMDIQRRDRGLEIGWTWLSPTVQRTAVNSECKLLLLAHAFEQLGAERVAFKTDARNERSQAAIARIGGQREGVLRRHKLCQDGTLRDTVYFSIIREEWPNVRERLEHLLTR